MTCERAQQLVDPGEPSGPSGVDPADSHVAGCADCQAQLAAMRRIAGALREVGTSARRAPDHLDRAFAAVAQPPRRRWIPLAGAGVALAAAAILVVWLRRPEPPRFAVDIVAGDGAAIRGDAHLGDRLRVRAREGAAIGVRVYRNDRELVLDCPRMCRREDGSITGEVVLDAIARYQVIWLDGPAPPATGSVDGDIAAATRAGARHEMRELEVR